MGKWLDLESFQRKKSCEVEVEPIRSRKKIFLAYISRLDGVSCQEGMSLAGPSTTTQSLHDSRPQGRVSQ